VSEIVRRSEAADAAPLVPLSPRPLASFLSLTVGVLITLAVRGYRFGESNHAVYLVDALRRTDPSLLRNDWWANSTLQYHFVFNAMTAALMRAGLLEPAFLVGYLLLAVLLHVGWRSLAVRLGGNDGTYLVSVVLYYLMAGGVGLGMYHFLQDSAFLPSNISNVAMLWAVCFWVGGRPAAAGTCLGIAGMFSHQPRRGRHRAVGRGDAAGGRADDPSQAVVGRERGGDRLVRPPDRSGGAGSPEPVG
jgi:hypothetical protein